MGVCAECPLRGVCFDVPEEYFHVEVNYGGEQLPLTQVISKEGLTSEVFVDNDFESIIERMKNCKEPAERRFGFLSRKQEKVCGAVGKTAILTHDSQVKTIFQAMYYIRDQHKGNV